MPGFHRSSLGQPARKWYHTFHHGVDVLQTVHVMLHTFGGAALFRFGSVESLGLLLAALGHDVEHPGMNNTFQVNSESELALRLALLLLPNSNAITL